MPRERQGLLLCLTSATAFGAMAIFAKLAYDHGANVSTLLVLRFGIAAAVMWLIVRLRGGARLPRRAVLGGIVLGCGYAGQAGCYFASLQHIDASLTALLLYTYPALVFCGALALGRERSTGPKLTALLLSGVGAALVLLGGGAGSLNGVGVALALGAAAIYTVYILVADGVVGDADPVALTAVVVTAALVAFGIASPFVGGFHAGAIDAAGYAGTAGVALVSTVLAATTFLLGLERVGASTTSIVSTVEPAVTVVLAAAFFGERLGGVQLGGGALVLAAVVVLQLRPRGRRDMVIHGVAPDHAAAAPPARPLAQRAT